MALKKLISNYVPITGSKILDVGSGNGGISIAFGKQRKTQVFGIDIELNRVKTSKIGTEEQNATADFLFASGQNLPFKRSFFDIVICNDVIEHVTKPRLLLKELHRSLRIGGVLYLCAPNGLSPFSILRDSHYGLFGLSLMPHRIGRFYVTKIRKASEEYDIFGPFNYWLLKQLLGSKFKIFDCFREQPIRFRDWLRFLPDMVLRIFFPVIVLSCKKK